MTLKRHRNGGDLCVHSDNQSECWEELALLNRICQTHDVDAHTGIKIRELWNKFNAIDTEVRES